MTLIFSCHFSVLNFHRGNVIHHNHSFGNLLSSVTTLDVSNNNLSLSHTLCFLSPSFQVAMLEDIDWVKPAKVIVDKEMDLSKPSRESSFIRTVSEQITIILFAYYNAILRRYRCPNNN